MTGDDWWVSAPHLTAVLTVDGGRVVDAAPILRWTVGRSWTDVEAQLRRKGWEYRRLLRWPICSECGAQGGDDHFEHCPGGLR